jgi:glycosyltransferase involved in cell wall biosynthesis
MADLDFSPQIHPGFAGKNPTHVKLSVVIPALNEAKRIKPTLIAIDRYLQKQPYMYEIIVVDNGSKDETAAVVHSYRDEVEHSAVFVLKEPCQGKGCTVQRGVAQARGDYVLFMDADNATRIEEMEKVWPKFKEGFDVVIGSRRIKGAKLARKQPWLRELSGRLGNLLIRLIAVPKVRDTQCGFKAFTKKAAHDIFSAVTISRWGFDIEVLALAHHWGYRVAEIPVTWYHMETALIKGSSYTNTLSDLFQVRRQMRTGLYDKIRAHGLEQRWHKLRNGKI